MEQINTKSSSNNIEEAFTILETEKGKKRLNSNLFPTESISVTYYLLNDYKSFESHKLHTVLNPIDNKHLKENP
jgi:hypothetical protein